MKNSEKISAQDLIDAIAQQTNLPKKQAEVFLRTFQSVVEEALIADRLVKIKGLGTFKLLWNEPRKSVNVQTGQEQIIPGHTKVNFTPEPALRDLINTPYLNLNPVNINEKTDKEDFDPIKKLGKEAEEIMALLSDLGAVKEEKAAPIEEPKIEMPIQPEELQKETEETEETPEPKIILEKPAVQKLHEREIPVKKSKKRWLKWLLWAVLLLALAGGGYYLWKNGTLNKALKQATEQIQIVVEKAKASFAKSDQTPEDAEKSAQPEAKQEIKASPDTTQSIFERPRVYDIFLTMEIVEKGTFLTMLAEKYYGNRAYWVYIYEANQAALPDPNHVAAGTRVKIPKLPADLIDTDNPKTIEYARELENKYIAK